MTYCKLLKVFAKLKFVAGAVNDLFQSFATIAVDDE